MPFVRLLYSLFLVIPLIHLVSFTLLKIVSQVQELLTVRYILGPDVDKTLHLLGKSCAHKEDSYSSIRRPRSSSLVHIALQVVNEEKGVGERVLSAFFALPSSSPKL